MKNILAPALCLLLAPAAMGMAVNVHTSEVEGHAQHQSTEPNVVTYDGPLYEMTAQDWEKRSEALAGRGTWERPAGMPVITLAPDTNLDLGVRSTLAKRSGNPRIDIFKYGDCQYKAYKAIYHLDNFGCGGACIRLPDGARSAIVAQDKHDKYYPTMDAWETSDCTGKRQHFGVEKTSSCTNVENTNFPVWSFIAYYKC